MHHRVAQQRSGTRTETDASLDSQLRLSIRRRSSRRVPLGVGCALTIAACCLTLPAQQPNGANQTTQQHSRITGKVTESATGAPIQGARITLTGASPNPGKPPNYEPADSQPDGSFILSDVPVGKYIVSSDKEGYVGASSWATLTAGGDVDIRFSLHTPASLSGRVVDGDGKGIPGIRVGAWVKAYRFGRPLIMQSGRAYTDEAGNYQIGKLRAGVYFVGVLPPLLRPKAGTPPLETHAHPVYARSFYPDGRSLAEAAEIPLQEEQQMTGLDIRMQKTNGYCVMASLPDWLSRGPKVTTTISESGSRTELGIGTGLLQSATHFYFCGVPSGDYILWATISATERTTSWFASQPVTVDKRDAIAETLPLEEARELKGQIVIDKGQLINEQPPSIGLQLEPVDRLAFADEDMHPKIESGGRLLFHRLYSGRYWVNVTSISPGYYVSQISAGSRDGMREPIQLGDGDLILTVRSDGPSLSGTVTTENGNALPPSAIVILAAATGLDGGSIRSTHVDQSGHFSFSNLAPGKFNLLALSGLSPEDAENPSVISRFASQAKEIDLGTYSSQQIELHPIPVS